MCFDSADRRLLSRNRNRNVINNFDGIRMRVGDENSPYESDIFALRFVEPNVRRFDHSNPQSTLYGTTFYLRGLDPHHTIEPFWLWLDQRTVNDPTLRKNLHSVGFHIFGEFGDKKAWDYDTSFTYQKGSVRSISHTAFAAHAEAGYSWKTALNPRLAAWVNYSTGDKNPKDTSDQRFDSIYGDNFSFYSYCGYFTWQNIINPAVELRVVPNKSIKCTVIYRSIWLTSDSDSWIPASRRDTTGTKGSFVGQELDARLVWKIHDRCDLDFAIGHFFPGGFVRRTGPSPESTLAQMAMTLRF